MGPSALQCTTPSVSPADIVENNHGQIDDKGLQVDVTADGKTYSFFRTKRACDRTLSAARDEQTKAAQQLDQYR
jgi:hypothetical protein